MSQQRQAAVEAERLAAQRQLTPLQQRRSQLTARLAQLLQATTADRERLQQLDNTIGPLREALTALEAAEGSIGTNADAAQWQGLQADPEAADRALSEARQRRAALAAERTAPAPAPARAGRPPGGGPPEKTQGGEGGTTPAPSKQRERAATRKR